MAGDCRDLIIWQLAMDLATTVYEITKNFPRAEMYGLTSQIRRSAVSIPSNIAEGNGRYSKNDFQHFLTIAFGSLLELETQIELSHRFSYLNEVDYQTTNAKIEDLKKTMVKFRKNLKYH